MSNQNPVLWDDRPDPKWQPTVESWGWHAIEDDDPAVFTYQIGGTCPHCNHTFHQDERIGIGYGVLELAPAAADNPHGQKIFLDAVAGQLPEKVTVQCNCNEKHDSANPGKKGCGQFAKIKFLGNIG